ncbi:MAG: hypothetical protein U9N86_06690, partial [Bacteroidota bacterium]|nr:hypothetical protein [Bacteroidota bacterium]
HIANYDHLIRQIMGVEKGFGYERYEFEYQTIVDNVSLLDDETCDAIFVENSFPCPKSLP